MNMEGRNVAVKYLSQERFTIAHYIRQHLDYMRLVRSCFYFLLGVTAKLHQKGLLRLGKQSQQWREGDRISMLILVAAIIGIVGFGLVAKILYDIGVR